MIFYLGTEKAAVSVITAASIKLTFSTCIWTTPDRQFSIFPDNIIDQRMFLCPLGIFFRLFPPLPVGFHESVMDQFFRLQPCIHRIFILFKRSDVVTFPFKSDVHTVFSIL